MSAGTETELASDDVAAIDELRDDYRKLTAELARIIVGQEAVIEQLAICLFARGHALLMGVPGLAKTLLVSRLAETMSLSFARIQFTPDLMPMRHHRAPPSCRSQRERAARVPHPHAAPSSANILLGGRNQPRARPRPRPPCWRRCRSNSVTVESARPWPLHAAVPRARHPEPRRAGGHLSAAAEAQLDRFMFLISVDYPSRDEEIEIARTTTGASLPDLNTILDAAAVLRFQDLVRRVPVPRHIYEFAVDLVRRTRPREPESPEWLKPLVSWGAGPRAVQYLVLGARARAALTGSYMVRLEDIMSVAQPVLTHRVLTTFNAESEGITSGDIVSRLVDELNAEPGR
jgi:MoxR-like ATPase